MFCRTPYTELTCAAKGMAATSKTPYGGGRQRTAPEKFNNICQYFVNMQSKFWGNRLINKYFIAKSLGHVFFETPGMQSVCSTIGLPGENTDIFNFKTSCTKSPGSQSCKNIYYVFPRKLYIIVPGILLLSSRYQDERVLRFQL